MARKQKAKVVARKSKSSKDKENSEIAVDASDDETTGTPKPEGTESSQDEPIIIEAEATDVLETAEDVSEPEDAEAETKEGDAEVEEGPALEATAAVERETSEAKIPAPVASDSNAGSGGTSIFALVFGGLIAGALGYFGASFAPEPELATSSLSESIAANTSTLDSISTDVATLMNAPAPELPDFEGRFSEVSETIQSLNSDLEGLKTVLTGATDDLKAQAAELDARILALETALPAASELPMGDELAALRERIANMTAEAEAELAAAQTEAANIARAAEEARLAAEAEAEAARAEAEAREAELAAAAERQAALIDLKSAIETGAPYVALLEKLGTVPEVLTANAESGVPTLQSLQRAFPEAAREALAQSETVPDDASAGERLTAFLKRRTNARSLTPQDGDSANAILSRAEAFLSDGDLSGTLTEIEALPESGKSAMAGWLEMAEIRLQASSAVDELSATN